MRILITGGAGFIGSNLAAYLLKEGHYIRILDNFSEGDRRNLEDLPGDLDIMEGDITSPEDCARACEGIDCISHQAALGSVPRSMLQPERYSFNNLHGFVVLCNQARLAGIKRIAYASSSSVYGDLLAESKREDMQGRPLSPYAASKQSNEDFAHAFFNAYEMTMVGFRYFNVFGPRQNPRGAYAAVIPLFISKLMKGEPPTIFGDGLQSRDFTFIGNVVQANVKALLGDIPAGSHVVNVACGKKTTVLELFTSIAKIMGSNIQAIHAPERKGDIRDSLADIQVAQDLLGYSDWISLNEGLKSTVAWYQDHPERLEDSETKTDATIEISNFNKNSADTRKVHMNQNPCLGIIGLGYVGLPMAVEFGKQLDTVGFDINLQRVAELNQGVDHTLEVTSKQLMEASHLSFTSDLEDLKRCEIYIITVPTPIDHYNRPDLTPLIKASESVGKVLKKGDIVIYESTVYPGCTEEDCVPVLEKTSGLKYNVDFFCGYSPERINPGDKEHTLTKIKKVTSGSTPEVADTVDALYKKIIIAGTHKASSIKVAEAAKIIENSQRDINIAFVNELALIFDRMGIDTLEVLEAASTKWNFLPFRPGFVGGHCIGVDPFYLTHKAESLGYHPEVILSGRRINDNMAIFAANKMVKAMIKKGYRVEGSRVLVLGITFKENCPDIRNSKTVDLVKELQEFGCRVTVLDPWADPAEVQHEYGITSVREIDTSNGGLFDAIVAAVSHREFLNFPVQNYSGSQTVLFDVKGILPRNPNVIRL